MGSSTSSAVSVRCHVGVEDDVPYRNLVVARATSDFIRLLAVTLAAGLLAMPMMRYVGRGMLRLHAAIPLQQMVMGVILFVVALVWLSTGFVGIGVLIVGTIIGLLPPVSAYDARTAWASSSCPS